MVDAECDKPSLSELSGGNTAAAQATSSVGQIMPDSGALGGHKTGVIKVRKDFEKYPWDTIENLFFDKYSRHFEALRHEMPEGMKAVGGPGNGIFECVQELVGYENLCLISFDDPELYADLFEKIGEVNRAIPHDILDFCERELVDHR